MVSVKLNTIFIGLIVITALSVISALTFGPADISIKETFSCLTGNCANAINEMVIWQVRVPRILVGLVAGMGLACAGAILQNTTRNPLADPYLFGIHELKNHKLTLSISHSTQRFFYRA